MVAGRPSLEINWNRVDELLEAGCLGSEIAPVFSMHPHTFYDHVEKKYGMKFSEFRQRKMAKGDSLLREVQYNKAIGKTKDGDNTLLIWLGKNRLNQRENDLLIQTPPLDAKVDSENQEMSENHKLRKQLAELQAKLDSHKS